MNPMIWLVTLGLILANDSRANDARDVPDFDFSGQAAFSGCSGSIVNFGQPETAQAVVMTNGHCVGMLSVPPETIFRNKPYATNLRLFKDRSQTIAGRTTKILYGIIKFYDIAFVELDATYAQLAQQGVRSRRLASQPLSVGATILMASSYFKTVTSCPILAIIPFIHEDVYRNVDAYKYRDCESRHGTSGSPLIDPITGMVVGMNYTGNDDGEQCTYNNPCEVDEAGHIQVDRGAGYGDPIHKVMTCLNPTTKEIDLTVASCALPK